jgi:transcriptional regulator with XRE-family HTH domain
MPSFANKRSMKTTRKPGRELTAILGSNIRHYRDKQRLSQEELAELCGLHRTYVGSVERCERNVTLSTLEAFAMAFGVPVPQLLTRQTNDE